MTWKTKEQHVRIGDFVGLIQRPQPAKTPAERLSRRFLTIEDLRAGAKKRLPGSMFDYIEGGGEDERSLSRNRQSFRDYSFLPRWGSTEAPDLQTQILGRMSPLPLILSPTGGTRLFRPEGEIAAARAAERAGIVYGLAGLSNTSLERVAEAAPGARRWFNFKPRPDKALTQAMLDRVAAAGYDTLVVNLDTRAIGQRERDFTNGFTAPPSLKPKTVWEGMTHPAWAMGFLANEAIAFPNLTPEAPTGRITSTPAMWKELLGGSYTPLGWSDMEDLRARWDGGIVAKGVVHPEDAVRAAEIGCDAVQVSNHGGRQLDHMASPMDVLPEIAQRVSGRAELIVDGGVRRGTDVVKALALGATAVAIGRPYLYGLAVAGQAGVEHSIQIFRAEIERAMFLIGCTSIQELRDRGPELVRHTASFLPTAPQHSNTH
ncbi:alpha-hydroxy acid oxidase [Leucobacter sp. M11]|uniref:alpha-hydroxy acid oxidase n=1 Tax=Leucobacter sp. M11 TaxID=2993565 RepID=UPI002D80DD80|nr:alpha-hydroxy acid oxidase [Leucobacter sp. M11]MEB4614226.1 alpha-hydroxy acid oxidase [Leucobacter sp. M11]